MTYHFYGWETATIRDERGLTPRDYYTLLSSIWCADTCAPRMRKDWTKENRTLGQCSITAFLMQDIYGGKVYGVPLEDGNFHCFNAVGDCVFDLTSEQFGDTKLNYENCPEQRRETHFAKAEKKARYEKLKKELLAKRSERLEAGRRQGPMKQRQIHLEKVTDGNAEEIVRLRVAKEQKEYVASNDRSLIDAYLSLAKGEPVFPFGIYSGRSLVGFVMISYFNDWSGYERDAWLNSKEYQFYKDKYFYYIWRFMIDKKYQRRGYGKEALKFALDFIRTFPCGEAEYCVLSYGPTNEVAKKLYRSFCFAELNEPGYYEEGDEISAVLKL